MPKPGEPGSLFSRDWGAQQRANDNRNEQARQTRERGIDRQYNREAEERRNGQRQ
jgi:hypothetical protein